MFRAGGFFMQFIERSICGAKYGGVLDPPAQPSLPLAPRLVRPPACVAPGTQARPIMYPATRKSGVVRMVCWSIDRSPYVYTQLGQIGDADVAVL